jgi:hypothetical protein
VCASDVSNDDCSVQGFKSLSTRALFEAETTDVNLDFPKDMDSFRKYCKVEQRLALLVQVCMQM